MAWFALLNFGHLWMILLVKGRFMHFNGQTKSHQTVYKRLHFGIHYTVKIKDFLPIGALVDML